RVSKSPRRASRRRDDVDCSSVGKNLPHVCTAVEVLDFFRALALAARARRHHCLAGLRGNKACRLNDNVPSGGIDHVYKLYSMQRSGNSYKVRLALALLNTPYDVVEIDILRGESRTPDFLAKNPSGHVPLLEVEEGRYIAESNAILWYVANGTSLSPESRVERAEALQWMFFEQHALEPNIG